MDFIFSLLTVGGLFFWLFLAVVGVSLLVNVHREKPGVAIFIAVLALIALQFTSDFKPFTWVTQHPWLFAAGVAAYLFVAVVWTVIKWTMFTKRAKEFYMQVRVDFIASLKRPFDVVSDKEALRQRIVNSGYHGYFGRTVPPTPRENKNRIMLWLIFWPIDSVWSIINDPVVRVFRFIYHMIAGTLQRISSARFKGFEELN